MVSLQTTTGMFTSFYSKTPKAQQGVALKTFPTMRSIFHDDANFNPQ